MKLNLANLANALARANGHPNPEEYVQADADAAAQIDAEALAADKPAGE